MSASLDKASLDIVDDHHDNETHIQPVVLPDPMHRLQEVRTEQGLSLRTISKRTGIDMKDLKRQEETNEDLLLSDLYRWQAALEVPIADLLVDTLAPLSPTIRERAQLVKIMKTVMALTEVVGTVRAQRMVEMLREQLVEIMPELEQIVGWPRFGARRPADYMGKIADSPISMKGVSVEYDE